MPGADGAGGDAAAAVLEVLGAYPRDEPVARLRRGRWLGSFGGEPHAGQGQLRRLLILQAADALAVLVEERYPAAGAGQGVVPATGLLPVPGGAMGLAAGLFACHRNSSDSPAV